MSARPISGQPPGTGLAARAGIEPVSSAQRIAAFVPTVQPGGRLIVAHSPHAARSEEIRALRTELLLRRAPLDDAEVIALLSPCAGEGRSQLAAELAIAFAQLGRPTLLVDADLRHPRQHSLFGADNERGLSDAIEFGATPRLHAVENLPQMFLVTAGAIPANPLELLLDDHFTRMVENWRRTFEFVVIDTAPVTPFSDGLAVASVAGRVLALSRAQYTPYQDTRDMLRRLAATRAQILGAVISHF